MGSKKVYLILLIFTLSLILTGFILSTPADIFRGLVTIVVTEDTLITDYFSIAGSGATFVNAGLVAIISIFLLYISRDPICGTTIMCVGLMSGFAMFGKNIANIWPIIFGTWIYAIIQKESFMKYTPVALLATSLSPIITFVALRDGNDIIALLFAILSGLIIGFVMPPLAEHTFRMQNGMNLYNSGFAAGLLAMILVSFAKAFGSAPEQAYFWSEDYHVPLLIYLCILITVLIVSSFFVDKHVLREYKKLVLFRGRMPNDYFIRFGSAATLLNCGLCGAIGLIYLLITGGTLNGPTAGAIFTIICFSANGKNPRNIIPIMLGVLGGSLLNQWEITAPAVQIAGLFCTALAPITDCFGTVAGLVAGFLHSSVVLYAGSPLAGLNLYNNGFAAGIVSIVMYPVLMKVLKHRRARFADKDYIDIFK